MTVGLRYRLGLYKRAAHVATHLVICRERLLVVLPDGPCFTAPVQSVSAMRKALQSAAFEHLRQKGKIRGYMVVTFRDRIATFISDASGKDEAH